MVIAFTFLLITVCGVSSTFADKYITRQITENTACDYNPSLYNGTIAWQSNLDGDDEIYYWDGTSTTQITHNTVDDYSPSLSNGEIAWVSDWESYSSYNSIYLWDGTSTTQLMSPNYGTTYASPTLYDGQIAWSRYAAGNSCIYYWDGVTTTILTTWWSPQTRAPSVYDGQVAFESFSSICYNIHYWDGTSVNQVSFNTNDRIDVTNSSLYNGQIAWQSGRTDNHDYDIYFWNGMSATLLSNSSASDLSPSLYNGQISWYSNLDGDYDIYFWDGTTTTKISDNNVYDYKPSLYDGGIAWYSNVDGDDEIYYARLASAWIRDALPEVDILDFTESDIMELADMYSSEGSGVVGGMDWAYLSGDLPGDTDGEVYEIGDSWIYEGKYYIKLGSGLEGTSGAIPDIFMPQVLALLSSLFIFTWEKDKKKGVSFILF